MAGDAEPIPTPTRSAVLVLAYSGREVATRSEGFRSGDARDKRGGRSNGPTRGMQF